MDDIAELRDALDRLHGTLDDLAVRGLRATGPQDLARLGSLIDEFRGAGAEHLAQRLQSVVEAVRADDRGAAAGLLGSMTAARLLDRFLTLEVAENLLAESLEDVSEQQPDAEDR